MIDSKPRWDAPWFPALLATAATLVFTFALWSTTGNIDSESPTLLSASFLIGIVVSLIVGCLVFVLFRFRQQLLYARSEESRYRLLAENTRDVIWTMDLEFNYTYLSPSIEELRGYTVEEVKAQTMSEVMKPESMQKMVSTVGNELKNAKREDWQVLRPVTMELELTHKAGHTVWAEIKANFIRDDDGKVMGLQGVTRDITDKKKMQEASLEKQHWAIEQQRALLDLVTSEEAIKSDFDIMFEKLAMLSNEWLQADRVDIWLLDKERDLLICKFVHDPEREKVTLGLAISRKKMPVYFELMKTNRSIEISNCRTDSRVKELDPSYMMSLGLTAMLDAPIRMGGEVVGIISNQYRGGERQWEPEESAFAAEIADQIALAIHHSNQRESEHALRIAKEHAEKLAKEAHSANEAKTRFLATMSHEIRTPMNAILGYSRLLIREENQPGQARKLESIMENGEHLLSIINEILDMSKIDLEQVELNPKDFSLKQLFVEVSSVVAVLAREKDLEFTIEEDGELPDAVTGDQQKLKQILMNILGNAVKFTATGAIKMASEYVPNTNEVGVLRIKIKDSGFGIPVDDLDKIFVPFYQVKDMESRGGTGLGMSISREFARLMGGDLTVSSTLGEGSEFTLIIKIRKCDRPISSNGPARRVMGLKSGEQSWRILIVDDGKEQRMILNRLLQNVGFEVGEANDGYQAVDKALSWKPHFIWMDMRMPGMDGYEATKRIKKEMNVPIVALSASAFQEDRKLMEKAGCDDHIIKPFQEADIFGALKRFLDVDYVYHAEDKKTDNVNQCLDTLEIIPKDTIYKLRQSVLAAQLTESKEIVDTLVGTCPNASSAMTRLLDSFQYEKLLNVLDEMEKNDIF